MVLSLCIDYRFGLRKAQSQQYEFREIRPGKLRHLFEDEVIRIMIVEAARDRVAAAALYYKTYMPWRVYLSFEQTNFLYLDSSFYFCLRYITSTATIFKHDGAAATFVNIAATLKLESRV